MSPLPTPSRTVESKFFSPNSKKSPSGASSAGEPPTKKQKVTHGTTGNGGPAPLSRATSDSSFDSFMAMVNPGAKKPTAKKSVARKSVSKKSVTTRPTQEIRRKSSLNPRQSGNETENEDEDADNHKAYTDLQIQVKTIRDQNPNAVLMVHVGHKYKFFGEDAKVAENVLGMKTWIEKGELCASVPQHRRDVHLRTLVYRGYRVGIVQQVETAALHKAGSNRNKVFERRLTKMVTSTTYIDEIDSTELTAPSFLCIVEEVSGSRDRVKVAIVSISVHDGEIIYDAFEDVPMRTELDARLAHLQPTEIIYPRNRLSTPTEKMITHRIQFTNDHGGSARIEPFDELVSYSDAFDVISDLCSGSELLAEMTGLPRPVVVALGCTIKHLASSEIVSTLCRVKLSRFTSRIHMLLAANTLSNLEIFENDTDHTRRGSLLSLLDRTETQFGSRLLKSWIGKPLVDKRALQERIDAVDEIVNSNSDKFILLRQALSKLPDLMRGLSRVQSLQCTPNELVIILTAFQKLGRIFPATIVEEDTQVKSRMLNEILYALPPLAKPAQQLLNCIHLKMAKEGNKELMWVDPGKYPDIQKAADEVRDFESQIGREQDAVRELLGKPRLEFKTIWDEEYVIEMPKTFKAPESWLTVNSSKSFKRYRTPAVAQILEERAQSHERMMIAANEAYQVFLKDDVMEHYPVLRHAVEKLAQADCLTSLAHVATQQDFTKPKFVEDGDVLEMIDGRHPMVEVSRPDPFVPNSISFSRGRCKVVSGPNMGGKSTCVRTVALLSVMAQIGSYVPAKSFKLSMLDAVLTRMGASDDIVRGRSTFMVEMAETSEILRTATSRSLVVLDELGRGTSTFDGMAIAHATLEELISTVRCRTLFITHYPLVARQLGQKYPAALQNLHVGYRAEEQRKRDGKRDVTFLYRLEDGIAQESFGVECARLAGLPEEILQVATKKSADMETTVIARMRRRMVLKRVDVLKAVLQEHYPMARRRHTALKGHI